MYITIWHQDLKTHFKMCSLLYNVKINSFFMTFLYVSPILTAYQSHHNLVDLTIFNNNKLIIFNKKPIHIPYWQTCCRYDHKDHTYEVLCQHVAACGSSMHEHL